MLNSMNRTASGDGDSRLRIITLGSVLGALFAMIVATGCGREAEQPRQVESEVEPASASPSAEDSTFDQRCLDQQEHRIVESGSC